MEIKGNIGDEVWIRAKIKRISVDNSGVMYTVEVRDRRDGMAFNTDVNETDIKVRKTDALAAALKAAEEKPGAAPVVPDTMYKAPEDVPRETDPEEIKDCKFCKHDTVTSTVCNGCEDFDKFEPLPEGQEEPEPDQVSEIWEGVKCETCAFKDRRGSEQPCNVCNSDFSAWAPIPDGVKRKRGRPKKATVEGLMEKAKRAREKKGGADESDN